MNYGRKYSAYKEEIELTYIQNCGVECELYSIIANVIRESECGDNISLRDVTARRETLKSRRFKGIDGFPDFMVLERVKNQNAKIYGCVEIKSITVDIKNIGHDTKLENQLNSHIKSFKKVLYTNGLYWKFYDNEELKWQCELGTIKNKTILWEPSEKWFELLEKLDGIIW